MLQDLLSFDKYPEQIYNDKIRYLLFSMRQGSQTHYTFTTELYIFRQEPVIYCRPEPTYCRPEPLCAVTNIPKRVSDITGMA